MSVRGRPGHATTSHPRGGGRGAKRAHDERLDLDDDEEDDDALIGEGGDIVDASGRVNLSTLGLDPANIGNGPGAGGGSRQRGQSRRGRGKDRDKDRNVDRDGEDTTDDDGFDLPPPPRVQIDPELAGMSPLQLAIGRAIAAREAASRSRAGRVVQFRNGMTIRELAEAMGVQAVDVVKTLLRAGETPRTVLDTLDADVAELIVSEFDMVPEAEPDRPTGVVAARGVAEIDPSQLVERDPIVTIMGHVDHGKTTLLDRIRDSAVAAGEAGGITQHIAAFRVDVSAWSAEGGDDDDGKGGGDGDGDGGPRHITFLDTPGHAAFSAMRSRGVSVTDIVVLVVSVTDGIQPQTVEVIRAAKDQGVPIVVAFNKIDRGGLEPIPDLSRSLAEHEVITEELGGDTLAAPISALTGKGLPQLIRSVLLQSDLEPPMARGEGPAEGVVVEAHLDRRRGAVATVLVTQGNLAVGDWVVAGSAHGRVRELRHAQGAVSAVKGASEDPARVGSGSAADALGELDDDDLDGDSDGDGDAAFGVGGAYGDGGDDDGRPRRGGGKKKKSKGSGKGGKKGGRGKAKGKNGKGGGGSDGDGITHVVPRGESVGPSSAVVLTGLRALPRAGDEVVVVDSEAAARAHVAARARADGATGAGHAEVHRDIGSASADPASIGAATLSAAAASSNGMGMEVPVVVKCDVAGSAEAIVEMCEPLSTREISPRFLRVAVGPVSIGDVDLAHGTGGLLFAFSADVPRDVAQYASRLGVRIALADVVYRIEEQIRAELISRLTPHRRTVLHGVGRVDATFVYKVSGGKATVAGTVCEIGKLVASGKFAVFRNGERIHTSDSAQSFKVHLKDVKEITRHQDCGIILPGFRDFEQGDTIASFSVLETERVLGDQLITPKDVGDLVQRAREEDDV